MDEPVDFEKALAELEQIVARMEEGSLSLEQSLDAFERGIKLSRACQRSLKAAQLRIKVLTEEDEAEAAPPQAAEKDPDDIPF